MILTSYRVLDGGDEEVFWITPMYTEGRFDVIVNNNRWDMTDLKSVRDVLNKILDEAGEAS